MLSQHHPASKNPPCSVLPRTHQSKTSSVSHFRLFGPDLIRGIAVLLVLVSHTLPWKYAAKFFGTELFVAYGDLTGVLGVEIFFVLSGYLIGGILIKDLFSGQAVSHERLFWFWKRRWFRTLPNYYFFLGVYLLISWHFKTFENTRIETFLWFGQAVFMEHPVFFNPAWSLAVEEWFYFLFPLVAIVFSQLFRSRDGGLLMCLILFLVFPIVLRGTFQPESWDEGTRKMTFFRLDSLMYGLCLAYIELRRSQFWIALQKFWQYGVVLFVLLVFWWGCNWKPIGILDADSIAHRTLPFFGISLCLFLLFPKVIVLKGLRQGGKKESAWSEKVESMVQKLSLWSYSIYLSHAAFIMLLSPIFLSIPFPYSELRTGLLIITIWISTIGFSAVWYRIFEKPLMDLRDYPWGRKKSNAQ